MTRPITTVQTPALLNPGEVAALLNTTPRHVRALISSGHLPEVRLGKLVRIPTKSVLDFVNTQADADVLTEGDVAGLIGGGI